LGHDSALSLFFAPAIAAGGVPSLSQKADGASSLSRIRSIHGESPRLIVKSHHFNATAP
jgi:hypothetical protein